MPLPIVKPVFCAHCGKLLKVKVYGDAMTPNEFMEYRRKPKKTYCFKCKMKNIIKKK